MKPLALLFALLLLAAPEARALSITVTVTFTQEPVMTTHCFTESSPRIITYYLLSPPEQLLYERMAPRPKPEVRARLNFRARLLISLLVLLGVLGLPTARQYGADRGAEP